MAGNKISKAEKLLQENEELRLRLGETEETLRAIRSGEVDAIVVSGDKGDKIFTLESAETPYRIILEEMSEGAVIISADGLILYCNRRIAELFSVPQEQISGSHLIDHISAGSKQQFKRLLKNSLNSRTDGIISLVSETRKKVHARLSFVALPADQAGDICIVVSDITEIKDRQDSLERMVDERTAELKETNIRLSFEIDELEKNKKIIKSLADKYKRLYNRVSESEEKYRKIIETTSEGVLTTNTSGEFVFMNKRMADMLGYKVEELLGKSIPDIMYDDIKEQVVRLRDAIRSQDLHGEFRFRRRDGSLLWTAYNASALKDNKGEYIGNLAMHTDITDRKQKEEELFKSEERFRTAFEEGVIPMAITSLTGDFIRTNHAFSVLTGYSEKELHKMNFRQLTHPDDLKANISGFYKLLNRELASFRMEKRYLRKNGEIIWVDMSTAPVRNKSGNMEYMVTHIQDINERKKAEAELETSKEKLEIALESGHIGIWQRNLLNDEVVWDERMEKIFGLLPGSFDKTFRAFEELIHEEDLPHFRNAMSYSMETGSLMETVFRVKGGDDGNSNYILTKALVNKDEMGSPVSLTGVCFDVTAMKRGAENAIVKLNRELLRSNKELESFAYVASHDLQEPLRMISSFTQMLEKRYGDKLDKNAQDYIKYAVDGAKRMYELINGLLAYSRVQSRGKEFTKIRMADVCEKVKQNLGLMITEKNAVITRRKLPVIYADESQMIQLIQNLFENGIKFSRERPRIHFESKDNSDSYLFSVKDNGIGIEPEYFDRIFKIFQRLLPREEYEGTGIGLAICRRIVERHDGRIWVESEPGKGSVFYFTIPKTASERKHAIH